MSIQLVDGLQTTRQISPSERALRRLDGLTAEAKASLRINGSWRIPWRLALQAVSLAEANDEVALRIHVDRPNQLTEEDLEALGIALLPLLPPACTYKLRIRRKGLLGSRSAAVVPEWRAVDGAVPSFAPQFNHGFWQGPEGSVRQTFPQLRALESCPPPSQLQSRRDHALVALSRFVDGLYPHPSLEVYGALATEDTQIISAIEPRLVHVADDQYQVRPSAPGVPTEVLEDHYYGDRGTVVTFRSPEGRHTRAVLSERSERGLRKLRTIDKVNAAEAAHIASHPEETFGPDLDTSKLSDRVIGLGPPVRRVHVTLREVQKQDWYDWDQSTTVTDVTELEEPTEISASFPSSLKDPDLRASLEAAIARADERGDHLIPDPTGGPGFIEVNEDLRQGLKAAAILDAEATQSGGRLKRPPHQVLQVHENLERVTFAQPVASTTTASPLPDTPPGLAAGVSLKQHQIEGYRWLTSLFAGDAPRGQGAMLADDMGLGKTLQVLSLLRWLQEQERTGPHLVVAPLSLLDNWQDETAKFFGNAFEPTFVATKSTLPPDRDKAATRLASQRIVLVTYDTLRRHELTFASVRWDMVILDEAQRVKELTSQIFRVVRTLNARGRVAMTGTPVENKLSELWALFDWATPGLLEDARTFQSTYSKKIKADPRCARELSEQLLGRIQPFYRRRMKSEVAKDLPQKVLRPTKTGMSRDQLRTYGQIASISPSTPNSVQQLLGICAHPQLDGQTARLQSASQCAFPKADAFFSLLDAIHAKQEKVLVFANRRLLQKWLADEIEARYETIVDTINGEVSNSRQRLNIIGQFGRVPGFAALVLSPRAAGVGLNIVAANHVIHYTREWNPAIENQATDRAYRLGQTRDVFVHYLISTAPPRETADEKLNTLLEDKRRLMDTFVVPMGNVSITPAEFT